MKLSQAILAGYAQVSGQAFGTLYNPYNDTACALGCALLGAGKSKDDLLGTFPMCGPFWDRVVIPAHNHLRDLTGVSQMNDAGMAIEDIAGILAAEGL